MPGLEDLASLLGMPESDKNKPTAKTDDKRRGHDGQVLRLRVRMEKRRGKPVSIAWGFFSHPMELNRLLTLFKKTLGAGGQLVDQTIEMQGDHVERMKKVLEAEGYKVGG
ncbi:MAG: translation initiation factor [Candidatus Kapabacteria bacterium]|nr:translation initiation factor [Candidatus Kapabacteria bacterium]